MELAADMAVAERRAINMAERVTLLAEAEHKAQVTERCSLASGRHHPGFQCMYSSACAACSNHVLCCPLHGTLDWVPGRVLSSCCRGLCVARRAWYALQIFLCYDVVRPPLNCPGAGGACAGAGGSSRGSWGAAG